MGKIIITWLKLLIFSNLFLFTTVFYFSSLKIPIFHIDEYNFLRKTYFFDLFYQRKFTDLRWQEDNFNQPRLGVYLYGLGLKMKGIDDIAGYQEQINFNTIKIGQQFWWEKLFWQPLEVFPANLESTVELIIFGRHLAAIFTLGIFFIILGWGLGTKNLHFSFWAILLLTFNRLLFYYGRVVMTDAFQLFFFFANLILSFYYLKSFFRKRKKLFLFLSLLIGINCAFTAGVKVIGVLALFFSISLFLFLLQQNKQKKYFSFLFLILSFLFLILSFYLLFVLLNPQIYSCPFKGFWEMFASRWESAEQYQREGGNPVVNQLVALRLIIKNILLPGNRYGSFGLIPLLPLDLLFFSGGIYLLLKKWLAKKKLETESILLIWLVETFFSLIFYLKNDWDRYYLPLSSAIALVQAYFLAFLSKKLIVFLRQRKRVLPKILRS